MKGRLINQGWMQLTLFVVLVAIIGLPIYTSFPRAWSAIGIVLYAVIVVLMALPRRPRSYEERIKR